MNDSIIDTTYVNKSGSHIYYNQIDDIYIVYWMDEFDSGNMTYYGHFADALESY